VRDREPFSSWPARPFGERSQVALEIGLIVYSMVAALVLCRLILLAIGIDDRLWIGEFVFQFSDPVVKVLQFLPGSERTIIGKVTLPDATLAALVALVSFASLARARPAQNL
jgi:uncharacterized protein YggT (Ycf19 family)